MDERFSGIATGTAPSVAGIIALAQAFALTITAEGIETEAQLNQLKLLSCEEGQGYFLGRPMPLAAICGDRLVCPWHKVAFNLADGRMCEPLVLANLKQYPLRIENGNVLVNPKAMSPAAPIGSGASAPVFVVLGSAALWRLRHEGFKGRLVLVEREQDSPYDRTALTKFLPSGKMDISEVPQLLKDDVMNHVERITATVTRLDSQQQRLIFDNGEQLQFDKLLIASGAAQVRPNLPGSELAGVQLLCSKDQTDALPAGGRRQPANRDHRQKFHRH